MSMSDSDFSSQGADYKFLRPISRDRLLHEMLGSANMGDAKSTWKVLIMDKVTVKVMSHSCKMADITDQGVSLVEDLFRRRQPLPSMDAVYFIQPSKENIVMFLSDMSGRVPLYKKAYVFFCAPIPKELVNHIKSDTSVLPRIGALREMNLEYFPVDNQGFITDHEKALDDLYGANAQNARKFNACLNEMAIRIATVFASLKELPIVRYRGVKGLDTSTAATGPELIPMKLASSVWNCIEKYKSTIPNFPQTETCQLLFVDRSIDQIAPVIHEWTYDAMCHDLLDMDGNKYVHEATGKDGKPETKEILLEDHDPLWVELRHAHIADASERLHEKMTNFVSKNKAAQMKNEARDGSDLSTRDLQKMVQALPQYNEQKEKLTLHVELAGKLNGIIRDTGLRDLGQLEQDLVFGDAGAKEVINWLRTNQDATSEFKLRLLVIYACVYPEKFEGDKGIKLMQLAKISPQDMQAVTNMKMLEGSSETKKGSTSSFSLKFDAHKRMNAARKDKTGEEETWQLFRFFPVIEELIEKLNKGELSKTDYQCINEPKPAMTTTSQSTSARSTQTSTAPHSMRSRRTANWAKPSHSDDGYSSDSVLKNSANDFKKMGQRIFIFIIGGATRSELRVCHKLTTKLRREVVLGSSNLVDPAQYINKLKLLSEKEQVCSTLNGLGI